MNKSLMILLIEHNKMDQLVYFFYQFRHIQSAFHLIKEGVQITLYGQILTKS